MDEIIRIDNLVKNYTIFSRKKEKTEIKVLKNISFGVDQKEFVAVMGKSGCGKTTLLKMLGMIDTPTDGEVYFKGKEIKKLYDEEVSDIRRRDIGFVFQDYYLMNSLSVEENVMLPMILDKKSKYHCYAKAKKIEKMFEIQHLAKKKPYELSGGEKQRVAICRALINNPALILADEPTGNLDSYSGLIVIRALKEINKKFGKTIIMVTHDPQMASYCNRVIFMKDGKIVEEVYKKEKREQFYLKIVDLMNSI